MNRLQKLMPLKVSHVYILLASLSFMLTSCSLDKEELKESPQIHKREVVETYTLGAHLPGSLSQVYQLELIIYSDGSVEASRGIAPLDPEQDYANLHLFQYSDLQLAGDDIMVLFDQTTWFIPFDSQLEPSQIHLTEGLITIRCHCSGTGNCNAKVTFLPNGGISAECVSRDCSENCNGEFTAPTHTPVTIPGIIVGSSGITVN